MLRKTKLFKKNLEYSFNILCNTLNIIENTLSHKKKIAYAKYVCYWFIHEIILNLIFRSELENDQLFCNISSDYHSLDF